MTTSNTPTRQQIRMQQRRRTDANWAVINDILLEGEIGYARTSGKFKFGDGTSRWNDLPWFSPTGDTGKPFFYPEEYGAVGTGFADDTAEVQAAIDAAYANGGGIVILRNRYGCRGDLTHKGGVSIWGLGQPRYLGDTDPSYTDTEKGALVALDGTFRFVYGTAGSSSGHDNPGPLWNVIVDGLGVGGAGKELLLAQSAQGRIDGCHIINSAGHGLRMNGMCQNTLIQGNYIGYNAAGSSIRWMNEATFQSAGGNKIIGNYIADGNRLIDMDFDGTNAWPHTTVIAGNIIEQRQAAHDVIVYLRAGGVRFTDNVITRSLDSATAPVKNCLVYVETASSALVSAIFTGNDFNGGSGAGAPADIVRTKYAAGSISTVVGFFGQNTASHAGALLCVDGAFQPVIYNHAEWITSGTPNPGDNFWRAVNGGSTNGVRNTHREMHQWIMGASPSAAVTVERTGDTGIRGGFDRDFLLSWGDGAGGSVGTLGAAFGTMAATGPWMFHDAFGWFPTEVTAATGTVEVDALGGVHHTIEYAAAATVNISLLNPAKGRIVVIGLKGNGTNTLTWANPISWSGTAPAAPADTAWLYVGLTYAGETAGWRELFRSGGGAGGGGGVTSVNGNTGAVTVQPKTIQATTATAIGTAAKTATVTGYTPAVGDDLMLTLTNGNTATAPTLNINGAGAVPIYIAGAVAAVEQVLTGLDGVWHLRYTGTRWALVGASANYVTATTSEMQAGTANSIRWMTAALIAAAIKAQTSLITKSTKTADYTVVAADMGTIIEVDSATPKTITVPTGLPVDSVFYVRQYGAGQVTVAPGSGMTLRTSGSYTTRAQYSTLMVNIRASAEGIVSGDFT